ncbi:hypothetical protein ACJIZ3_007342 [Penstemon smallii]|uniref:Uncharacterized protein n=1 Tax=Penstemon smallii TaxID=265156 RepID=A0ABD3SAR5_9LAMI
MGNLLNLIDINLGNYYVILLPYLINHGFAQGILMQCYRCRRKVEGI